MYKSNTKAHILLNKLEEIFLILSLLFITGLLTLNVIGRYFFGVSLKWAEELVRYTLIWLTFIGSSACVRKQKHVSIDVLLLKLQNSKRIIAEKIINMISFLFCIIITYYGINITYSLILSKQISSAMMIPMYLAYLSIPIGGGFMSLRYFFIALSGFKEKWVEKGKGN